jgi:hypothetical protein
MQTMQREMCKAGVIEEMVDDAFEALNEEEDEEEADSQARLCPGVVVAVRVG